MVQYRDFGEGNKNNITLNIEKSWHYWRHNLDNLCRIYDYDFNIVTNNCIQFGILELL